jgi:hypothetical protein
MPMVHSTAEAMPESPGLCALWFSEMGSITLESSLIPFLNPFFIRIILGSLQCRG